MNHALKQLANCSLLQRKEMRGYVMPTTSAQPTNHVLKDPEVQLRDEREKERSYEIIQLLPPGSFIKLDLYWSR